MRKHAREHANPTVCVFYYHDAVASHQHRRLLLAAVWPLLPPPPSSPPPPPPPCHYNNTAHNITRTSKTLTRHLSSIIHRVLKNIRGSSAARECVVIRHSEIVGRVITVILKATTTTTRVCARVQRLRARVELVAPLPSQTYGVCFVAVCSRPASQNTHTLAN